MEFILDSNDLDIENEDNRPLAHKIFKMRIAGYGLDTIAKHFNTTASKFQKLLDHEKDLSNAFNRADEIAVTNVTYALYQSAIGYKTLEIHSNKLMEEGTDGVITSAKIIEKQLAPDIGAARDYLKAKNSQLWDKKTESEDNTMFDIDKLSVRDRAKMLKNLKQINAISED